MNPLVVVICTMRSFARTSGNPLNSAASTTVKTAALIPMPSASIAIATMVKLGLFRSVRTPWWTSCTKVSAHR